MDRIDVGIERLEAAQPEVVGRVKGLESPVLAFLFRLIKYGSVAQFGRAGECARTLFLIRIVNGHQGRRFDSSPIHMTNEELERTLNSARDKGQLDKEWYKT